VRIIFISLSAEFAVDLCGSHHRNNKALYKRAADNDSYD